MNGIKTSVALLAMVATLTIPAAAFGQAGPFWYNVGSACVVDPSDVNEYETTYSQVRFRAGVTGSIVTRCNVTVLWQLVPLNEWNRFGVTYKDPDATGTGARIVATVKKVSRTTGTTTTMAIFDSNRFAGTGTQFQEIDVTPRWNFWDYYYFVEITLSRTSSTLDVELYGVRLYRYSGAVAEAHR